MGKTRLARYSLFPTINLLSKGKIGPKIIPIFISSSPIRAISPNSADIFFHPELIDTFGRVITDIY